MFCFFKGRGNCRLRYDLDTAARRSSGILEVDSKDGTTDRTGLEENSLR